MRYFWKALFVVVAIVTLWSAGKGGYDLWGYYRLSGSSEATVDTWEVVTLSSSKYAYAVTYHFDAEGKTWKGKQILPSPIYPNRYAAEGDLKTWKESPWMVYFIPGRPQINTLERPFPWKSTLYGLMSLVILLYLYGVYLRYRNAGSR